PGPRREPERPCRRGSLPTRVPSSWFSLPIAPRACGVVPEELRGDHGGAKDKDRAREEHGIDARPARDEPEHGAGDPKRQIEKRRVSAHGEALVLRRRAPNRFDAETRIDQRPAEARKRSSEQ